MARTFKLDATEDWALEGPPGQLDLVLVSDDDPERLTVRVWRAPGSVPLTVVGTADHGPIGDHCCVIGEFCPDMALARVESGLRRGTITARDTQP